MSLENYPASDETKEHARQLVKTALACHSAAGQTISVLSVQEAVPTKMLTAVILTHHKARRVFKPYAASHSLFTILNACSAMAKRDRQ